MFIDYLRKNLLPMIKAVNKPTELPIEYGKRKYKITGYCLNCKNIRETEMIIGDKKTKALYCRFDVPCEGYEEE